MGVLTPTIVWLILLAAFLVIEAVTLGLTTIWFAGGALAAFLISLTGIGVSVQVVIFLAVSLLLLILIRPLTQQRFNGARVRTNAQSLIGETAVVTEPIDNLKAEGRVTVRGQEWSARNVREDEPLERDTRVRVTQISGVKLLVERIKEEI